MQSKLNWIKNTCIDHLPAKNKNKISVKWAKLD